MPPIFGDTEITEMLRVMCRPIFEAAGLRPDDVKIILVDDPELQAFVAGGQNMFIYRGLLESADDPGQVVGVVAHETGHMAGGHLVRADEGLEGASYTMILATLLGAAAAAATGSPGAVAPGLMIGQDMGIRTMLAYSRGQEAAADAAGMSYLEKAHISSAGLLEFMKKLHAQEGNPITGDNKYLITHPPTQERIEALAYGFDHSASAKARLPAEWIEMHARMKAKLLGYFSPGIALRKYDKADNSIAGRYGRAIALWRLSKLDQALPLMDGLIAAEPKNPYFLEIKGQALFENGRIADAIPPLKQAAALAPAGTEEIHAMYAQVMLEHEDASLLPTAIEELKTAQRAETRDANIHRLLAIAYGRQGKEALAKVELAEQAILEGRIKDGRYMAMAAMRLLPSGSREWLRAQDLIATSPRKRGRDSGPGFQLKVGPAVDDFGQNGLRR